MATYTDIIARVRTALNEPSASMWLDTQLRAWINNGLDDIARYTDTVEKSTTGLVVAIGQQTVALPADVMRIQHVYFLPTGTGEKIPLVAQHYEQMDAIWGSWQTETNGDPVTFAPRGTEGSQTVYLYPVPDRAGTLTVFYLGHPVHIAEAGTNDATTVDLPPAWVDLLVDYVEYRALRRSRDPRWQEAYGLYVEARDLLAQHDTLTIARQMVHDPVSGGIPRWLSDPDFE